VTDSNGWTACGFREVRLETVTRSQRIGDDVDDAVAFIMSLPQSQQLLDGVSEDTVAAATAAVRAAFAPHAGADGVSLKGSAWPVSAYRCPRI
jgi:hypothetical protein